MLLNFIELLFIVILASVIQKRFKIPSPITILTVVIGVALCGYRFFELKDHEFDILVLLTLPLLIAGDALKLHLSDIKKHGLSLFYVAVIAVGAAIGLGVLINDYVLVNYPLSLVAVILLFSMITATDPVTVSSVFSNFKVPHKLKLLTEGESLFNDATALIIFSLALTALTKPDLVTPLFIAQKSFLVIFGASFIGLIAGLLCVQALKMTEEAFTEAIIIIFFTYLSYYITELFHFSGILAIIVCVLFAGNEINKLLAKDDNEIVVAKNNKNFPGFEYALTNERNHVTIIKLIDFLALFASGALFASVASVVNFEKLMYYKWEILAVFLATTIIRALTMIKFAMVSQRVNQMQNIQKHWLSVLTFAGSKGALSILMVHMIPSTFEYKVLFETIVVGVILLSTFIYAAGLAFVFVKNKDIFEKECNEENH